MKKFLPNETKSPTLPKLCEALSNYSFPEIETHTPVRVRTLLAVILFTTPKFDTTIELINTHIEDPEKDFENLISHVQGQIEEKYSISLSGTVPENYQVPLTKAKTAEFFRDFKYAYLQPLNSVNEELIKVLGKTKLVDEYTRELEILQDPSNNVQDSLFAFTLNPDAPQYNSLFRKYYQPAAGTNQYTEEVSSFDELSIKLKDKLFAAMCKGKSSIVLPHFVYVTKELSWDNVKVGSKVVSLEDTGTRTEDIVYVITQIDEDGTIHISDDSTYTTGDAAYWASKQSIELKEI